MSECRVRQPGTAWRSAWGLAALVYALVLAASPLLHHDLSCELKSRTHCTTCASGVSGPGLAQHSETATLQLAPAGPPPIEGERSPIVPFSRATKGRSPPAA